MTHVICSSKIRITDTSSATSFDKSFKHKLMDIYTSTISRHWIEMQQSAAVKNVTRSLCLDIGSKCTNQRRGIQSEPDCRGKWDKNGPLRQGAFRSEPDRRGEAYALYKRLFFLSFSQFHCYKKLLRETKTR